MSDTQSHYNELRLTIGGTTVEGRAHSLSAWFVLALRIVIGFAFSAPKWHISGIEFSPGAVQAN